ncbi:MAG: hypothetical protein K6F77_00855 [Lachnospiraceae bacterium]|nr:hypothetical protein [Lachnospiraceae bacterium]
MKKKFEILAFFCLVLVLSFGICGCNYSQTSKGKKILEDYYENKGKDIYISQAYTDVHRVSQTERAKTEFVKGEFVFKDNEEETHKFVVNTENGRIYTSENFEDFNRALEKKLAESLGVDSEKIRCKSSVIFQGEIDLDEVEAAESVSSEDLGDAEGDESSELDDAESEDSSELGDADSEESSDLDDADSEDSEASSEEYEFGEPEVSLDGVLPIEINDSNMEKMVNYALKNSSTFIVNLAFDGDISELNLDLDSGYETGMIVEIPGFESITTYLYLVPKGEELPPTLSYSDLDWYEELSNNDNES